MIQYIFSPRWFYGIDIIFELFSIVVVALIARYGYKLYGITQDEKHKRFSLFFLLIGVAFLFKILANFDIYYLGIKSIKIANTIFYFQTSHVSEILFYIGFTVFKFLMMLAFFGLVHINWKGREGFILMAYFIAVVSVFSYVSYYIFHISMIVLITALLANYFRKFREKGVRDKTVLLTPISFIILLLSQAAFTAIALDLVLYVIGEVFQLAGFCILLYEYIMVIRYEK